MSNTVYTTKVKVRPERQVAPVAQDDVEEVDAEYVTYDDEVVEPSTGMFSSPGRVIAFVGSLLMLAAVMFLVVMLLNNSATQGSQSSNGKVSTITNGNIALENSGPRNGMVAPEFEWLDAGTNQPVRLSSLRGKPVFLNFWGTWCPPCRAEMPEMQAVYNKHKDKIAMIGISFAPRDYEALVQDFIGQYQYTWSFLHDPNQTLGARYQTISIPISYFIDKDGIIRATHVGAMDRAMMEKYLQQAGAELGQ